MNLVEMDRVQPCGKEGGEYHRPYELVAHSKIRLGIQEKSAVISIKREQAKQGACGKGGRTVAPCKERTGYELEDTEHVAKNRIRQRKVKGGEKVDTRLDWHGGFRWIIDSYPRNGFSYVECQSAALLSP